MQREEEQQAKSHSQESKFESAMEQKGKGLEHKKPGGCWKGSACFPYSRQECRSCRRWQQPEGKAVGGCGGHLAPTPGRAGTEPWALLKGRGNPAGEVCRGSGALSQQNRLDARFARAEEGGSASRHEPRLLCS